MPAAKRIADAKVQAALTRTGGNVALAARILGVSRRTLARRVEKNPTLMEDPEGIQRDEAMAAVLEAIHAGDARAIKWFLNRYGHRRGFAPRQIKVEPMPPDVFRAFIIELRNSSR